MLIYSPYTPFMDKYVTLFISAKISFDRWFQMLKLSFTFTFSFTFLCRKTNSCALCVLEGGKKCCCLPVVTINCAMTVSSRWLDSVQHAGNPFTGSAKCTNKGNNRTEVLQSPCGHYQLCSRWLDSVQLAGNPGNPFIGSAKCTNNRAVILLTHRHVTPGQLCTIRVMSLLKWGQETSGV